jgi:hypothetical protein
VEWEVCVDFVVGQFLQMRSFIHSSTSFACMYYKVSSKLENPLTKRSSLKMSRLTFPMWLVVRRPRKKSLNLLIF